jgi:hypothetical protein
MNATPHKHAELIKQWADAPEWWDVYRSDGGAVDHWSRCSAEVLTYGENLKMKLEKSAKHPDNLKPKKRLIDWSKMPIGTMTDRGEIRAVFGDFVQLEVREKNMPKYDLTIPQNLRLKEQTQFTYWGGGKCPVPEGVVVETVLADRKVCSDLPKYQWLPCSSSTYKHVVGYRIIGLADGWTDNPEEAV